jgi:hypothetical protein
VKIILQLLCISLVVGAVMAGTEIYNPVLYGPVAIGQWNAVSNFAGVAATNGIYTNSVTYQYRLTATNSLGRLPYTVTNSVVIDGATNNSAHLTWTYTPRVSCYVLERGTTGTWDQFVRIGASLTNAWDDGSSLVWTNGNYAATNECALSDFPTGGIPVVGITAGTFYDGANGDYVSNAVVWKTDTNGWVVSAHTVSGVTAGTYYDGANGDYVSNAVVWKTDTNGWVVSAHEAWLTTESDPAYATGAVRLAGATMTGGLTNLFGYFGNGAGLTNLASDPSGWSGYAATQQVVWYEYEIVDDTNYVVITGTLEPDATGVGHWEVQYVDKWGYYIDNGRCARKSEFAPSYWVIWVDGTPDDSYWRGGTESVEGEYVPTDDGVYPANSTGTATVVYGTVTNVITWRAGYDTNIGAWAVSRNGTDMQAWYPGSNVLTGPVVIGGVQRDTWPSEYDDSAIYGALNTVSNWTIAGSNLAATVAGNLSVVSNQAAAGSNLAATVAVNLSVVSNWTVAAVKFDGTELSNSVAGLGILITNAAEQATNYADSVGSAVGLVASNALPMNGGGTVTGDVAVTGGVTAGTLALTNGPEAGSVWVCTNSNGSGELRTLGKMTLRPLGREVYSGSYSTSKWDSTPLRSIGNMVASENGITVKRDGTYLVSMLFNVNGVTNPAQYMRAQILLDNTRVYNQYGPMSAVPNNMYTISCSQSICVGANSGQTFGVQYYMYNSSVGQTNGTLHGGHLSVIELP